MCATIPFFKLTIKGDCAFKGFRKSLGFYYKVYTAVPLVKLWFIARSFIDSLVEMVAISN